MATENKTLVLSSLSDLIDDINDNFVQLPPTLTGNESPTRETVAQCIGQKYLNTTINDLFTCSEIIYDNQNNVVNENTEYRWDRISGKDKYKLLVESIPPSTTSYADGIGQQYLDSVHNNLYVCTNIADDRSSYEWILIAKGNVFPIIVIENGEIEKNIAKGIGQLLINMSTNDLYICTAKESSQDVWCPVNTDQQQIVYSEMEPTSQMDNNIWLKKNAQAKNEDGLTNQVIII